MQIDELIVPRWLIPVEPAGVTLENHAVALDGGRIVAILPAEVARQQFQPETLTLLPEHVLIPGLINLHTHAAMTLLRGIGDDLPLDAWLQTRIWPVEHAVMSYDFVLAGARLACLEMLRGGVTCFNDMYFFPDATARAALETGMRASIGLPVIDFPSAWASDPATYLSRGLAVRDALRGESTVRFTIAPHAPYTVGDATFMQIATLSDQIDAPVHLHLHETVGEIEDSIKQHGCRPVERLERLGLIGPQLIAVHAVHLDPSEIELFARRGVSIAHCPASNLKLGSGIAAVSKWLDSGINVGVGTDGTASNNRLDMVGELRLAALLAKGSSGRADVLGAHQLLHCGTLAGARALGLDQEIGSIIVGKQADLVAFDLSALDLQPCYEPVSHLFFVAGREHVSDVWVRGNPVVRKRQFIQPGTREAETEGATALSLWQNRVKIRNDSLH